jgi:hypothetical protein
MEEKILSMYAKGMNTSDIESGHNKKWTGHRQDWSQIHSQLEIYFEERLAERNL